MTRLCPDYILRIAREIESERKLKGIVDTRVLVRRGRRVLVLQPHDLGPDDEVLPRSDPCSRMKKRARAVVEMWKDRRVLVCGGRNYADQEQLYAELDRLHAEGSVSVVVAGGARGADTLAAEWAASRGVPCEVYMVEGNRLDRKAGPMRNERMLVEGKPDLVVAFPGGRGTDHMVGIAREAGVEVIEVDKRR